MSRYRPYPAYKDSGVEWLGAVPEGWQILPLCALFKRTKSTGHESEELLSVYRDHGVVLKSSRDDNNNKPSDDLSPYQLVEPSNLVTNKMKTWQGSIAISPHRGIVSPAYFVFQSLHSEVDEYLHHLLRSLPYITGYMTASKGIRVNQWDLDPDLFARFPVLLPTTAEQKMIATHLDRETARIDGLVGRKTRFIELLCEKRQALITRAVTKGLDPGVKMKDSGVEWLGQVPEHWDVGAVKNWYSTTSGGTPDTSQQDLFYTDEGGYPWIRTTDLNNDRLVNYEIAITDAAVRSSVCTMLSAGSVLVAMYGGGGTIGKNALLDIRACINQALCALLPNSNFVSEYTFRYMQFYKPYWMIDAESTRKDPNISQELVRNAPMLKPPLAEQCVIADHLDRETARIDTLISKTETSIALLKERRSALITAAVTGQIDLRAARTAPAVSPRMP